MDSERPFGHTHRQKRTHAQMELEGSSSPTWGVFNHFSASREPSASASHSHSYANQSARHLPRPNNMPANGPPPTRWPGDGLDYRRPISSAYIDLTSDDAGPSDDREAYGRPPRPPRFGREIMRDVIDLDAEDTRTGPAPSSPEIEIISSRRLEPPRRNNPPPAYYNAEGDDVEFVSINPLPESGRRHQNAIDINAMQALIADMGRTAPMPHLQEQITRRAEAARRAERQRQITMNRVLARFANRERSAARDPTLPPRRRGHIHVGFMPPDLNFGATGFNLGLGDSDHEQPARPPTYDAPAKAPAGFTRSPQEEERLICPNCSDELCCGDSDIKKQVWIAKQCGHVYCGECTANRSIKKSAKGKEKQTAARTKPFKECVVDGCSKKVTSKSHMFQVFL